MAQHVARAEWVQHGQVQVRDAAARLPELEELPPIEDDLAVGSEALGEDWHARLIAVEHAAHARLAEAQAHADAQIAEAKAEAERWQQHALASESEGYARGFTAGYADGAQQGKTEGEAAVKAETRALVHQLTTLTKHARTEMRSGIHAAQEGLATLSLEIARAVIGEALRADPALLARRIDALLAQVGDTAIAVVRVCPEDHVALQSVWPAATRARRTGEHGPRIVADASLAPGDCIVEGHTRYFDARLEPLFAAVVAAFAAIPPEETPMADEEEYRGMVA
jgi:flagellar biosynthesis/type III secretory pathway protein FliH